MNRGRAADRVERPHRGVHPARRDRLRPREQRLGRSATAGGTESSSPRRSTLAQPGHSHDRPARRTVVWTGGRERPVSASRLRGTTVCSVTVTTPFDPCAREHAVTSGQPGSLERLRCSGGGIREHNREITQCPNSTHAAPVACARPRALVPLALLSAAFTASIAGANAPAVVAAGAHSADTTLPDGTAVPTQAIEAPASVSNGDGLGLGDGNAAQIVSTASTSGIPSAALSAYQRAETGHQRRGPVLQPDLAADRRHRPRRVQPRPRQRQRPGQHRPRRPRHLRHRAQRLQQDRRDPRHRRRPVRQRHDLRPRGRPDAVHPLDLVGRGRGRRR